MDTPFHRPRDSACAQGLFNDVVCQGPFDTTVATKLAESPEMLRYQATPPRSATAPARLSFRPPPPFLLASLRLRLPLAQVMTRSVTSQLGDATLPSLLAASLTSALTTFVRLASDRHLSLAVALFFPDGLAPSYQPTLAGPLYEPGEPQGGSPFALAAHPTPRLKGCDLALLEASVGGGGGPRGLAVTRLSGGAALVRIDVLNLTRRRPNPCRPPATAPSARLFSPAYWPRFMPRYQPRSQPPPFCLCPSASKARPPPLRLGQRRPQAHLHHDRHGEPDIDHRRRRGNWAARSSHFRQGPEALEGSHDGHL